MPLVQNNASKEDKKSEQDKQKAAHDLKEAEKLINKVAISGNDLSRLKTQTNLLAWITKDKVKKSKSPNGDELFTISKEDYLDVINEYSDKTYTMNEALGLLKGPNFNEYEVEAAKSPLHPTKNEIHYYKGDDKIVFVGMPLTNKYPQEVEAKDMSLDDVVTYIAQIVANRAAQGNNFGTVLIPEGLIEFIPAMKRLIAELNDFLAENAEEFSQIKKSHQRDYIIRKLSPENAAIYASLPEGVARQLTLDRDPHGNVQVSLIETEKLLSEMVATKLAAWKEEGKFVGKFASQHHFFGYEGRCAAPSNYDADYCYSLGYTAASLIANGKTGYMSSVRNTTAPADQWIAGGVPITMMMNMERRHGEMKPVIQKALVKLDGAPFKAFAAQRDQWAITTDYVYPGPIQYFGPTEVCDQPTKTLQLEQAK